MFGIGFPELLVILVVALVFIGPKRLPQVARSIGAGYRELQKAISGVKDEFEGVNKGFDGTDYRAPMPPQSEEEKKAQEDRKSRDENES